MTNSKVERDDKNPTNGTFTAQLVRGSVTLEFRADEIRLRKQPSTIFWTPLSEAPMSSSLSSTFHLELQETETNTPSATPTDR